MAVVVYAIVVDVGVDGSMQFYACHFGASELLFHQNIVYMVTVDFAEHRSHAAAYSGLLAIGNGVVAHYVRAYVVFAPSAAEHVEDHLDIVGCAVKALVEAVEIVTAAPFLAQCYAVGA